MASLYANLVEEDWEELVAIEEEMAEAAPQEVGGGGGGEGSSRPRNIGRGRLYEVAGPRTDAAPGPGRARLLTYPQTMRGNNVSAHAHMRMRMRKTEKQKKKQMNAEIPVTA